MADENVALSGKIYAATSGVIATATNEIADFRGNVSMDIPIEVVTWNGQSLVVQHHTVVGIAANITFSEVLFKPETFGTVFGITATSASVLEFGNGTVNATVWSLTGCWSSQASGWKSTPS